ncbi:hypothetical protein V2J09_011075, partial [Rumex salicifolius]
ALPIRILTVGKKRSRGVQLLVDEYSEELNYYCSVEHVQLRSNPRNARVLSDEASLFMVISTETKFLGDAIMLDEGGSDISSEHMAELIGDAGMMVCSFAHSGVIYSQMYQLPEDNILINFLSCRLNFVIYFVLYTIHGASRLSYYCWNTDFPGNFSVASGHRICRINGALASSPRALEHRVFIRANRVPGE